jgi:hypothetical protein
VGRCPIKYWIEYLAVGLEAVAALVIGVAVVAILFRILPHMVRSGRDRGIESTAVVLNARLRRAHLRFTGRKPCCTHRPKQSTTTSSGLGSFRPAIWGIFRLFRNFMQPRSKTESA